MKNKILFLLVFFIASLSVRGQVGGDSITFEKGRQLVHIDTAQHPNVWQIGTPQKVYFDSAYSRPYAILTDTITPYPKNNISTFTIAGTKICGSCACILSFWHKYYTDSLEDGGYIEASTDTGKTWTNISSVSYSGIYNNDTIQGGIPAFTGKSNGWQYFYDGFFCLGNWAFDSILFRFTFKSDTAFANKDGWMIDNIVTRNTICEGIPTQTSNKENCNIFPNPNNGDFTISFSYSELVSESQTIIEIYNVLGEKIYDATLKQVQGDEQINIRGKPSGVYFYRVLKEDGSIVGEGKVVVEK